jgi:hypothetical protein
MAGRVILALIAAVGVTEMTIAVVNAHLVMGGLVDLGVEIPLADRLATYGHDVIGLAERFVPILGLGFAVAFTVAWAVVRWLLPGWGRVGYPLAGAVTVALVLVGVHQIFQTHPVAGARTLVGSVLLIACGALGGAVFAAIASRGVSRASGTAA